MILAIYQYLIESLAYIWCFAKSLYKILLIISLNRFIAGFGLVRSKLLQSCLTLCHLMDCNPPDYSVHGILQARVVEWVALASSIGSSQPRGQICTS